MPLQIQRATKQRAKLRLGLAGPAGAGKTYTALRVALAMAQALGGSIDDVGVIDTEHRSSEKYVDIFGQFGIIPLENFDPRLYIEAIQLFERDGYKFIVIDSLSHAWAGKGGALELKDKAAARNGGNSYTAWGSVTPLQNQLIDTIIGANAHVIATLRAKQDYAQEVNERGKTVIRRLGLAPIQRDGMEYEFDVYGELDQDNVLTITKTRCPALRGAQLVQPGENLAAPLLTWLDGPAVADIAAARRDELAALAADAAAEASLVRIDTRRPEAPAAAADEDRPFGPEDVGRPTIPAAEADGAPGSASRPDDGDPFPGHGQGEPPHRQAPAQARAGAPEAVVHRCHARAPEACAETYTDADLIVFGGKRFSGKALAERTIADCGKTLCAPHAKAWNDGEDVLAAAS